MKRFFLHGGPGLCTLPEQRWIDSPGQYLLWDQPRIVPGTPQPFKHLLDETAMHFMQAMQRSGSAMMLVATSFGVHLAFDLIKRYPEHIARLVLLAPTIDVHEAYLRLAQRVQDTHPSSVLLQQIEAARARPHESGAFWELVGTVLSTPDFVDLYWGPGCLERREQFKALLGDPAVFDFASFHAILDDFLFHHPRAPVSVSFDGPVEVVFGMADSLLVPEVEQTRLSTMFPQAQFRLLPAGHFLHLEQQVC